VLQRFLKDIAFFKAKVITGCASPPSKVWKRRAKRQEARVPAHKVWDQISHKKAEKTI